MAVSQTGTSPALSSDWTGLSGHLIASFFAVKRRTSDDKNTIRWERDMSQPEVLAPLSDGNIETTLNWHSPFENVGPDQKFSSLSALLQSGGFNSALEALQKLLPSNEVLASNAKRIADFEGRSSLTKLNSTQTFTGMPPIKISLTAHFRAFKNSQVEVRAPMDQLMSWALPKKIAEDGPVASALNLSNGIFTSYVPQIIGLKYGDMLWAPLVIESMPYPLTGPRDASGTITHASITMQIATLTALDKDDYANVRTSRAAFNY